jgi:hypothetical protein
LNKKTGAEMEMFNNILAVCSIGEPSEKGILGHKQQQEHKGIKNFSLSFLLLTLNEK